MKVRHAMTERNDPRRRPVGRAAAVNPSNRFERINVEDDLEQLGDDVDADDQRWVVRTEFFADQSRTIIRENDSPDIQFRFSVNPYRGCEHGCAYCYARPSHETLGLGAGLDFETKILVKHNAARLLRGELAEPSWRGEVIALSGVTDCYQPAERRFRITRSLLEVMREARQPVGIVTKNALVLRDLDLLRPMARQNLVRVILSITTLDEELARAMEPRTATPSARLRAIGQLTEAGVPVSVLAAPVVAGLTDHEIPAILRKAKQAGAGAAGYQLLRLPTSVVPVFIEWLTANLPHARERVESMIRATRGGRLNDPRFGHRMRGGGSYAAGIRKAFEVFAKQLELDRPLVPLDSSKFRPPKGADGQLRLF